MTEAGQKLIREYIAKEANARLSPLVNNRDGSNAGLGMLLARGDGAQLATAQKLAREGYIQLLGRRHHRIAVLTEAGRSAALAQAERA